MSLTLYGNDLARQFDRKQSIAPADLTATTTGSEVSVVGCHGTVVVVVEVGVVAIADASNYFTITVTQATATGGSFSAADSAQYDPVAITGGTTVWDRIINATTEGSKTYAFNFTLARTYDFIKVVATETGTAQAILGAHVMVMPLVQPATGA